MLTYSSKNILNQHTKIPRQWRFFKSFKMNQVYGAPIYVLNLMVPFHAQPQRFISCHFSILFWKDSISLYSLVINAIIPNLSIRLQVVELWSIKCGSFCARTRKDATTWLQEEYTTWVMRLHWINIHSKGLCKSKVSTKGVCNEIL